MASDKVLSQRSPAQVLTGLVTLLVVGGLAASATARALVRDAGAPTHAQSQAAAPHPGSTQSGDSLFPWAGNGGYDVRSYDISLDFHPTRHRLVASTRLTADTTSGALSSFAVELQGLHVDKVTVDGRPATYRRDGVELLVSPARPVRNGFSVRVAYHGQPGPHTDPDKSSEGWLRLPHGGTALNEPVGAMTWFPVNDTPRDKARFAFHVTAPSALGVAANGVLVGRQRAGGHTTWTWSQHEPMAPYLALVSIGRYTMFTSHLRTIDGRRLPVWTFIGEQLGSLAGERALLPRVLRCEPNRFGPYPFGSAGLVVHRLDVGYSLETQTRPFLPGRVGVPTLVHELAHQWFGDSVTPRDWGDIWLNEGFATYTEWLWRGAHGGRGPEATFRRLYSSHPADSSFWRPAPAALYTRADLFGTPVYDRGAMTLQALRDRVGTKTFFQILKSWAHNYRHSTVSTDDFIGLAERLSGKQLDPLFQDWLYTPSRPAGY